MAITMVEAQDSQRTELVVTPEGARTVHTRSYVVDGSASWEDVRDHILTNTPTALAPNLVRMRVTFAPIMIDEADASKCSWRAQVEYSTPEYQTGSGEASETSFDTTGATEHITQSLETIGKYAPGSDVAPEFEGAIGVDENGNVRGVDIVAPSFRFQLVRYRDDADMGTSYRSTLYDLTGKVNSSAYTVDGMTFNAGELLFLGARAVQRGWGDWQVTYDFLAKPNRQNITIGGITVPEKQGHDYLWVLYKRQVDANASKHKTVSRPVAAYVERVYERRDFTALDLS